MKSVTGITFMLLATMAWAQNDENQMTPRQLFDYGMKAPAAKPAARPKPPSNPTAANPKTPELTTTKTPEKPEPAVTHPIRTAPDGTTTMQLAAYSPLALKYSILQLKGERYVEVDPDTEFHTGDHVRVKVEANDSSYLYIVMLGSSGQSEILFPSKDIAGGDNHIDKGSPYTIPPNGSSFFFDATAGVEKLSLALTRQPVRDLEKLIYEAGDPTRTGDKPKMLMAGARVDNRALGQFRDEVLTRDLVFEKYTGPSSDGEQEKAVYAATKDKSPDARLWVDFQLKHK